MKKMTKKKSAKFAKNIFEKLISKGGMTTVGDKPSGKAKPIAMMKKLRASTQERN